MTLDEQQVISKLKEHGLKYVYDETTFYNMFKLSRKEFLEQIENTNDKKRDKLIMNIVYKSDKTDFGRRGVQSLK